MARSSVVKVVCKSVEACGAEYEQRMPSDVLWSDALYDAAKPTQCGVCGSGHIRVIEGPAKVVRV